MSTYQRLAAVSIFDRPLVAVALLHRAVLVAELLSKEMTLYPGMVGMAENVFIDTLSRSIVITADIET